MIKELQESMREAADHLCHAKHLCKTLRLQQNNSELTGKFVDLENSLDREASVVKINLRTVERLARINDLSGSPNLHYSFMNQE